MKILRHNQPTCKPQPATVAEFLHHHPLPPELAPYRPAVERFPDVGAVTRTLAGLVQAGFTVEQIGAALEQAAAHATQDGQRCAACLNWTSDGTTYGQTRKGSLILITLCPKCFALAATGRPTAAMTRNLTAYVREGVQP